MTPLLPNEDRPEMTFLTPSPLTAASVSEGERSSLPRRKRVAFGGGFHRLSGRMALFLLCLGLLYLMGCGGGASTLAFDGGGFPIGGRGTRLYGIVISAENPLKSVANATVTVLATAPNGESKTLVMPTNTQGMFDFSSIPTADPVSKIKLSVVPAAGSDRKAQHLAFTMTSGQTANLVVALPPDTFDSSQAASISLTPQVSEIHGGDTVHITALLLDSSGKTLNIMPSLLFSGNFGSIGSDSNFTSDANGIGLVTALFDLGNDRQLQMSGQVIANSTTISRPPPPPTIPIVILAPH